RSNLEIAPPSRLKLVPSFDSRNLPDTMREVGKFIVVLGLITTLVGLVLWSGIAPKWLGRLPGDIRIEREHSSFYFPIVTCILLSIVLSLLFSLFSIFRR